MKTTLSKLERRWRQTKRLVAKLDKQEREASRKASKAHYALMHIETNFGELYENSFGKMTSSNKVTEIGRLLSDAKIPFTVLRQRETAEHYSAYRITVRGEKMTNKVVGTFLGVKLASLADDYINRCLHQDKATSTFVVHIYENNEGDTE